jgi:hypothetical protein
MNQDDDQPVRVSRDEARTLKRCQVPIAKALSSGGYPGPVEFLAPRWAASALRQCSRGDDRRAVMTLLRRARHDVNVRDALRAAIIGGCVAALAQAQKATT